jgi:RHS repeat-associated protein
VVAITGAGGATAVVERFSYDPFGKRRNANGTDDVGSYQTNNSISSAQPHRGYTGHEMLEEMGIVHMNGRLYDPRLGRVMSADPIVQAPAMSQSYNRYSYVMNGPLSLTDPSGFSWWTDLRDDWLKPAAAIVVAIYAPQISGYLWGEAYAGVACYAGVTTAQVAIVQGATAGFLAGAITGGTVESAFYGGISGAAFGSLHGMDQGVDKVIAHGLAGGVMARAQGGDFGSGFLASAFTQAASMSSVFGNPGEGTAMRAQNAIMAGIVGGTASVLGGGKFANGAVTGAMSRLLNDLAVTWRNPTNGDVRGCDAKGCGNFGESRDGGSRSHDGLDYTGVPGGNVYAVTSGTVTRIGYAYSDNLSFRYVEIDAGNGVVARELYVSPATGISVGVPVNAGDVIGTQQSLAARYPGITEHVHVEIRVNGTPVNPSTLIPSP